MDILSGLSAASTAINIAKDLRDIDRSVDEATYKLKIAELVSALADTKLSLSDAKQEISSLKQELATLNEGEACPVCRSGRLVVTNVEKWDGRTRETHTCVCNNDTCDYATKRVFSTNQLVYLDVK
jgi:hypothetical protein